MGFSLPSYQDSNITAKEIVNNDNITSLIIESKTNLLEYKGNLADTLNGWNKWNICFNGIIIEKSSIKDS